MRPLSSGPPDLFWDIGGGSGHPVRATISEMGPLLLSHLLELNDTQTGVIYATFDWADDQGLLLLDLKDLRSLLSWISEHRADLKSDYGNISAASVGAIQRHLLVLEEQAADRFFSEPALQRTDLMHTDFGGRGVISLFDAGRLVHQAPRVYSAFLLWLMAELFEQLPEVVDAPVPKLVLFFNEAHFLFANAGGALLENIEQVVRPIRSKGVGIYFITQNPTDLHEAVLGQLGLKVQHALRAYTPKGQRTIKAVNANPWGKQWPKARPGPSAVRSADKLLEVYWGLYSADHREDERTRRIGIFVQPKGLCFRD